MDQHLHLQQIGFGLSNPHPTHTHTHTHNPIHFPSLAPTPPAPQPPKPPPPSAKPPKPPAQCSYCGMTFKKLEHCQRHERTHTLARPYACSVCLKTFARQDTLNRHLRLHSRPDDGSASKPKKRPHKNSTSSLSSSSAADILPPISTPTLLQPQLTPTSSPYRVEQIQARAGRERGFSLSAVDEHSTNLDPYPFPLVSRQSISLPPQWNQYPQLLTPSNLLGTSNWNPLTHQPPPPAASEASLNSSPPIPNSLTLSPPTPLESSFLLDLNSYSLSDHHHLTPPMSAPATCTTYGPFASTPDIWSTPCNLLNNNHNDNTTSASEVDWLGLDFGRSGSGGSGSGGGGGGRSRSASQPSAFLNPWSLVLMPSQHQDTRAGWDDR